MNRRSHLSFIDRCKFALAMLALCAPLIWIAGMLAAGQYDALRDLSVLFLAPVVGIGLCLAGMLALYICIAIVRIVYRELLVMFRE